LYIEVGRLIREGWVEWLVGRTGVLWEGERGGKVERSMGRGGGLGEEES